MNVVFQSVVMGLLGIIAVCTIVFPILFLCQRKKQHREFMQYLQDKEDEEL